MSCQDRSRGRPGRPGSGPGYHHAERRRRRRAAGVGTGVFSAGGPTLEQVVDHEGLLAAYDEMRREGAGRPGPTA